jgi:uncharacterized RDD family membrane protein YckC
MEVSKGKRFGAYFIDTIVSITLGYLIGVFVLGMDFMTAGIKLSLVFYVFMLLRDLVFNGQSLGKKLLGYKVTDLEGNPANTVGLILRNVSLFSFLALVDCILVILDKPRLGDMIAKTKVVNVK